VNQNKDEDHRMPYRGFLLIAEKFNGFYWIMSTTYKVISINHRCMTIPEASGRVTSLRLRGISVSLKETDLRLW
jgi:hypothetical protein